MPAAQRMAKGPDGRPIVSKTAATDVEARDLAEEAEVLCRAAHPGVVEVLRAGPTEDGGYRLDTRLAGVRTLATVRPSVLEAAGIVAALATTVADLHGIGVVHGAITPEHVVLDAGGSPVLCGFGRGRRLGVSEPGADVAGLGDVLATLVGDPVDAEPIPERRFGRRSAWTVTVARRSLQTLADHARADDVAVRPSARALAGAVLAAVPGARLPGGVPTSVSRAATADRARLGWPGWSPWRGAREELSPGRRGLGARRSEADAPEGAPQARFVDDAPVFHPGADGLAPALRAIGAVGGLGLVVFGIATVLGRPPELPQPRGETPSVLPSAEGTPASASAATTAGTTEPLPLLECPPVALPAADPDGDGCGSAATIDGSVVEVDGVRYGVGEPGDRLALADWDCDGSATVAAVRPATGEVFVFPGWAAPGDDLVVPAAGRVAGADHVVAEDPDGDGCPTLVVVTVDGARAEVPA